MSDPAVLRSALQDELDRLRAVIETGWTWQGQGKSGCGLCGAIVHDQQQHLDWHLRCAQ